MRVLGRWGDEGLGFLGCLMEPRDQRQISSDGFEQIKVNSGCGGEGRRGSC